MAKKSATKGGKNSRKPDRRKRPTLTEVAGLRASLSIAQDDSAALQSELAGLRQDHEAVKAENKALTDCLAETSQQLDTERSASNQLLDRVVQLHTTIAENAQALSGARDDLESSVMLIFEHQRRGRILATALHESKLVKVRFQTDNFTVGHFQNWNCLQRSDTKNDPFKVKVKLYFDVPGIGEFTANNTIILPAVEVSKAAVRTIVDGEHACKMMVHIIGIKPREMDTVLRFRQTDPIGFPVFEG